VLLKAREIPRGEVRTYGWVAAQIGRPLAVRAVGTALRKNPVPVFIPCHRVVRSNGQLGQYALGGTEQKAAILSAEGVDVDEMWRVARSA
jgi:methylated-DNA-[protein]-cysteine S-methyltransferase